MLCSVEDQCCAYIGIGLELLGADREDCIGKKPWFVIRRVDAGGRPHDHLPRTCQTDPLPKPSSSENRQMWGLINNPHVGMKVDFSRYLCVQQDWLARIHGMYRTQHAARQDAVRLPASLPAFYIGSQ